MEDTTTLVRDGSEPAPDPLEDAMRVVRVMRREALAEAKKLEVLCAWAAGCTEWARFRSDEPRLLCAEHARAAQQHGAKLWRFEQPEVVYALHRLRMYRTHLERQAKRESVEERHRAGTLRGHTMDEMERMIGKDLVVEDEDGRPRLG